MEFRKTNWYNDLEVATLPYGLMESNGITNVLFFADTAGRRGLDAHAADDTRTFVRWVGANHSVRIAIIRRVDRPIAMEKTGIKRTYFSSIRMSRRNPR